MNAIILCTAGSGHLGEGGKGTPRSLLNLAGQPVLTYILNGLARLSLTRLIITLNVGSRQIKRFTHLRLPETMLKYVHCPEGSDTYTLTSFARAIRFVQPTNLLIVRGDCIFSPEIIDCIVRRKTGVLISSSLHARVSSTGGGNVVGFGGREPLAAKPLGIQFIPRSYLPALRGVLVELLSCGAGGATYCNAFTSLAEKGYVFKTIDISSQLYTQIEREGDLPAALDVALELQRKNVNRIQYHHDIP